MGECICVDCPNKCYEYHNSITCDKAYYEWCLKEDKCITKLKSVDKTINT